MNSGIVSAALIFAAMLADLVFFGVVVTRYADRREQGITESALHVRIVALLVGLSLAVFGGLMLMLWQIPSNIGGLDARGRDLALIVGLVSVAAGGILCFISVVAAQPTVKRLLDAYVFLGRRKV